MVYLLEFLDVSFTLLGHHPELDLERHLHVLLFLLIRNIKKKRTSVGMLFFVLVHSSFLSPFQAK
jgi:hypothetical protein